MAVKNVFSPLILAPLAAALLAGCSDSGSSSSSTVSIKVQVGQEDIEYGLVRIASVTEGGQIDTDSEGRLDGVYYETDENGYADATVYSEEVSYFELVGRQYDDNTDTDGTTVRCQWVDGCSDDGTSYAFGDDMETTSGMGWRAVSYDLNKNELIRVTPLTDLAAQLAYDYVYSESDAAWSATGYYSPYSVEQAISQVSRVFNVDSVEGSEPADLTQINEWSDNSLTAATNAIRYGALVAAWRHLEESYGSGFTAAVAGEFSADAGQMLQSGNARTLSLETLYNAAVENLQNLTVTNSTVQTYVSTVITGLEAEVADLQADAYTSVTPATLASLFSSDDLEDYELGILRAKAFVSVMRDYDENFFEDGYKDQLDAYADMLKEIGDSHADDLDTIVQRYVDTEALYATTYLADSGNVCADYATYNADAWIDSCSYNAATAVMTLNGGEISVGQMVADVNTTDDDDTPSSSHAIDVLITGRYEVETGGEVVLRFDVDNTYEDDDPDNDIESASGIRVYFTDEVSALDDPDNNEVIGYEIRWSDFDLYDPRYVDTDQETEVTGSFRLFYRGVRDPLDASSDLHFNIDTVVLNGRVSDVVGDEDDDDRDYSTVYIAATAENASDYYPEKEFASFNGFFTPNTSADFVEGDVISDLVAYERGTETVSGTLVDYLDVRLSADGEPLEEGSARYRFYPTVQREDSDDIDDDDDTDEIIETHDVEVCELEYSDTAADWSVSTCDPKTRVYEARDTDEDIQDLWEAGLLSRISVSGRGDYFVSWPDDGADSDGCYVMTPLAEGGSATLSGTLYEPIVLGLSAARLRTYVRLYDEPKTLFDMVAYASTADKYTLQAALSHDYSSTSTSGDVYVGTGSDLDRIVLAYDTDSNFDISGSAVIYKDGVSLSLDSGTTETVDSSLGLYLKRSYGTTPLPYKYITNDDGEYELCVTDNIAEDSSAESTLDDAVYYLNFRDVVYGSIRQESGVWVIRYIDGSWETL
ncbi:MAG: hypothetical protein KYX62_06670 [Pseudomonadota bacterium]|nr:hypothetical protein [Pseudomonadota bacterium]